MFYVSYCECVETICRDTVAAVFRTPGPCYTSAGARDSPRIIKDDGDMVSVKPVMSREANAECEKRIHSKAYFLSVEGKLLRNATKDFTLTAYNLTTSYDPSVNAVLKDINAEKLKYAV